MSHSSVDCRVAWLIAVAIFLAEVAGGAEAAEATLPALASIRLRNPTSWTGHAVVEVPVGHLALPGQIDWTKIRLVADDGREVPFAVREGRPHWKARLIAPVTTPRAEDLLVFAGTARSDAWSRIDLVAGPRRDRSAMGEQDGRLLVSYPDLQVTIQPATGMVAQIVAFGEPLLDGPLAMTFRKTPGDPSAKASVGPPRVRLAASSSTAAMTELHFVLDADDRLSIGLSYRIHACGLVEIWSDERPWQGASPWVDHAAEIKLPLAGSAEPLPYLVNRAPFYGFKDYAAAVKHVAAVRRRTRAGVLELGEETTNGRRWNRRLYVMPADRAAQAAALAEVAEKGLVVDITPMSTPLPDGELHIVHPPGAHVPARVLAEAIRKMGRSVTCVTGDKQSADVAILFQLLDPREAPAIEGDGFEIRPQAKRAGVTVVACTRFGLMQAALRMAEHLKATEKGTGPICAKHPLGRSGKLDLSPFPSRLPLIASSPAAALRGAGFGGGDFEVDFPHGSDAEWQEALDQLVASGMNVMADLGMWSNWKMPVSFRAMPELRSTSPDAYDEVSGAKLAVLDAHREHGLKLLRFLHDRGVKVWLWLPVGCVPTTYAEKHPEAMAPAPARCPCFTHPLYERFLQAFLKEILETYPIDGIVMIRDDNGGLCPCERCKAHVAASRTRSAAWEQYLILYRWLRGAKFPGDIAVYPYFDLYEPRLDPLLPEDLLIVGHGSGAAMLARSYATLAPMGDTWLDNLFASFRVPTAARMRRLVADRNSFWLGGALCGSELPWQAIGRFGWEPTATVNSLRYQWAAGQFGLDRALAFVELTDAYERLWEINDLPLLPHEWVKLSADKRRDVGAQGRADLDRFRRQLTSLRTAVAAPRHDCWFRHLGLFATYFEYHLRRLEVFSQMSDLVVKNKQAAQKPEGLPEAIRRQLLAMHREVYDLAQAYDREAATVPGKMLARTRALQLTLPFKEFVAGYDPSLDGLLEIKQFAGSMTVSAADFSAGRPFVLRVELKNTGVCPWIAGVGHRLEVRGDTQRMGLPAQWDYDDPPMAFGDRRTIELRGVAPKEPGEAKLHLSLFAPFRNAYAMMQQDVTVRWK